MKRMLNHNDRESGIQTTKGSYTMKRIVAAILTALALSAISAWAHSGGTNSQGCHYNHKIGMYHCH